MWFKHIMIEQNIFLCAFKAKAEKKPKLWRKTKLMTFSLFHFIRERQLQITWFEENSEWWNERNCGKQKKNQPINEIITRHWKLMIEDLLILKHVCLAYDCWLCVCVCWLKSNFGIAKSSSIFISFSLFRFKNLFTDSLTFHQSHLKNS